MCERQQGKMWFEPDVETVKTVHSLKTWRILNSHYHAYKLKGYAFSQFPFLLRSSGLTAWLKVYTFSATDCFTNGGEEVDCYEQVFVEHLSISALWKRAEVSLLFS